MKTLIIANLAFPSVDSIPDPVSEIYVRVYTQLPYSPFTSMTKHRRPGNHVTDRIVHLCTSPTSVSSLIAEDPNLAPGDAWERLYGTRVLKSISETYDSAWEPNPPDEVDELARATKCGNWGPTKPSELFLKIYHDALCTLDQDPHRAIVSPPLIGSYGFMPLTIISVMPDIVRHMSNVIVRAQDEVFLATNYWENSVASKYITNAIRELDRRAALKGTKIVLKILYDRGSQKQLYEPHYVVPDKEFGSERVNLPLPSEIPNIDMQVVNFHKPLLGTFHAKYMVVDRKIALLQSNNIQDNDNLEMLVHLEGPIVDSLYDMALISWHKKLDPPLPSYKSPAANRRPAGSTSGTSDGVAPEGDKTQGPAKQIDVETGKTNVAGAAGLSGGSLPEHTAEESHYDRDIAGEVDRSRSSLAPRPGRTHLQAVTRLLNHTLNEGFPGDPNAPPCPPGDFMTPYIPHHAHTPYPMALVNRAPYGTPSHRNASTPQNGAWLSALRNAKREVLIVSPTLNASPLLPAIRAACERGVDVHCYVTLSYDDAGELLPFQGGHNEKVSSALHTSLSSSSAAAAALSRLHYHWYVAKDQTAPIPQSRGRRLRSSHVKLMLVDGRVAVVGSGNQDTQSWFHSQEVNLLVDSEELCGDWRRGLERNQNTRLFGRVDPKDGVWRDAEGREVEGAIGPDAGGLGGLVEGVKGAVRRVRGTGGF